MRKVTAPQVASLDQAMRADLPESVELALCDLDGAAREVNGFLRGWARYFRCGNSAPLLDTVRHTAVAARRETAPAAAEMGLAGGRLPSSDLMGLTASTGPSSPPGRSGGRPNAAGEGRR